ncbi:type II secretion system protein F [Lapidilactobacillus concavus]|uniref:type II secretion system F family protein n=1 Tax=Lapidilactobacillus concavus TaxID=287844 RepID=UPI00070B560F|nr:type II secretion system F family protein [Lapidilactobacillus concavus]GEL12660.1 type II secretion system protein F [Lapidilactobacillus concavus]
MEKSPNIPLTSINSVKPRPLKAEQLTEFLELCGELLKNGYPVQNVLVLAPSLKVLSQPQVGLLADAFKEGQPLAQAMAPLVRQPNLITQLEIAEAHGNLATCCRENAQFLRERQEQSKQLRGLLAYPIFLIIMMMALLAFIQLVLKPQLNSLMPEQTSQRQTFWPIVVGLALLLMLTIFWIKLPIEKRRYYHLKMPIVHQIWSSYYHYLLFTDLAHLIQSGLSLQEILGYVSKFDSKSLQVFLARKVEDEINAGQDLRKIIHREPLLPNELLILLAKGEERQFQAMELQILAQRNFHSLNRNLKRLIEQVQPLLFIVIAVIIAVLYLQILLPIYQIMRGF